MKTPTRKEKQILERIINKKYKPTRKEQMTAEDYLNEYFPKGDKRRGQAMVLYALAKIEGSRGIWK